MGCKIALESRGREDRVLLELGWSLGAPGDLQLVSCRVLLGRLVSSMDM